tara:strand:+ start:223 stop:1152 length:930 start_codon:yes stop_codon:yes gene_type:complete
MFKNIINVNYINKISLILFFFIVFLLLNNLKKEKFKNIKNNSRKLIYLCCFLKEKYIKEVELLVKSIFEFGKINNNTDILIITDYKLKKKFDKLKISKNRKIKFFILDDIKNIEDACFSRYRIINYNKLQLYNKILYLDTDIIISNELKSIFNINPKKFIVLKESYFGHKFHGGLYFPDKIKRKKIHSFSSGIIYFKNTKDNIKTFQKVLDMKNNKNTIIDKFVFDQPVLNYILFNEKKYDNISFGNLVENNPQKLVNQVICHFPGGVGSYKYGKMNKFYNIIKLQKKIHDFLTNYKFKEKLELDYFYE